MSARPTPLLGSRALCALAVTVAMLAPAAFAQQTTAEPNPEQVTETGIAPPETGVSMEFETAEATASTEAEPDADTPANAAEESTPAEPEGSISDEIENLKQELLQLNRDLFILEEELLYPANSQLALYLSMDVGEFFALDSVKVHLDGKLVASELYTEHQVDALFRGGVQRLYLGNLKTGEHTLTAFFIGIGPNGREYKRAAEVVIDKRTSGKVYELKIKDSTAKLQPVFEVKEWLL